ncbi:MAG: LysE family translocator [Corynebacterium sp.]|nr:LysE family translocator [Corynebacterium sp.]
MLTLAIVWFVAVASPGPDVFQILRVGTQSRINGIACALGIMTGNAVWTLLSVLGVGMLIADHPVLIHSLQALGGCYLLYMGIGALRSVMASRSAATPEAITPVTLSPRRAYLLGVTTNFANPKALIFFISVFSQFVTVAPAWFIAVFIILTGIAWFVFVALAVNSVGPWLQRHQNLLDGICGAVFTIFAFVLFYEALQIF